MTSEDLSHMWAYESILGQLEELEDRAERAEASLVIADGVQRTMKVALEQANAALARVRALADALDAAQRPGLSSPAARRIRAAIEGDNQ